MGLATPRTAAHKKPTRGVTSPCVRSAPSSACPELRCCASAQPRPVALRAVDDPFHSAEPQPCPAPSRHRTMTTTVPVLRCEVTVTVIRAEGLATHGWRAKTQSPYVVVRAMQDLRPLCTTERTTAVRPQPMRAHPLPPPLLHPPRAAYLLCVPVGFIGRGWRVAGSGASRGVGVGLGLAGRSHPLVEAAPHPKADAIPSLAMAHPRDPFPATSLPSLLMYGAGH